MTLTAFSAPLPRPTCQSDNDCYVSSALFASSRPGRRTVELLPRAAVDGSARGGPRSSATCLCSASFRTQAEPETAGPGADRFAHTVDDLRSSGTSDLGGEAPPNWDSNNTNEVFSCDTPTKGFQ